MKVCGFTFVRNAVKFDYPVVEAISSILPVCDEMVVCVGQSDDGTLRLVEGIPSGKIRIVHSVWDDTLRKDGRVLALETDKALDAVPADADWAFYIQADEVVHEKYLSEIKQAMEQHLENPRVDGLLFKYVHFYGDYHYVGDSRTWYRNEIRIVRNDRAVRSFRDAQGFRKNGRRMRVKEIDAAIHHYGWVRNPAQMNAKQNNLERLYGEHPTVHAEELFDYSGVASLQLFNGTHPAVMQPRISRQDWEFVFDVTKKNFSLKDRLLYRLEQATGKRLFEYKNDIII
jgi:glycosyltransferase involved in cell wall biosynthesis